MVDRETCISTINKFLQTKNIEDAITLFEYACELKEVNQPEAIKQIASNTALVSFLLPHTIDLLMELQNLNKVMDKNNNLILVF